MPESTDPEGAPREQDLTEKDVLTAAANLVAAFRATDTMAYFASFTEDATFVFHTEDRRLGSRAEYEELWGGWLEEGWHVTECTSGDPRVQLIGGTAVFSHDVTTTTSTGGSSTTTHERETIVFHRTDAGIKAVHEHLSPCPARSTETGTS